MLSFPFPQSYYNCIRICVYNTNNIYKTLFIAYIYNVDLYKNWIIVLEHILEWEEQLCYLINKGQKAAKN